jgi:gliding motility associated protien GldN
MLQKFLKLAFLFVFLLGMQAFAQTDAGGETPADTGTDVTDANGDAAKPDSAAQASGAMKPIPKSLRLDGVFERKIYQEKEIIPYDNIREADVFWSKRIWRVIDLKEKMNLPFAYPKTGERFFEIIHRAVLNGEVQAFSPLDDEFTTVLKIEDVKKIGAGIDTQYVPDPITGDQIATVIKKELNPEDISKIRLKEDWFFDEETSTLQVRILGISPVRQKFNDQGDLLGVEPMYWVYYPDLRPIFIKHEIFNTRNDAIRMTWEDVMEFRFFSSYIYKESNVYDRKVDAYTNGIDALLEGEKIKNDIFIFEHDLWSY